jgi:hypothetical protein
MANKNCQSVVYLNHYRKIQQLALDQELDRLCDHRDSLEAEDPYLAVIESKIENLIFELHAEY